MSKKPKNHQNKFNSMNVNELRWHLNNIDHLLDKGTTSWSHYRNGAFVREINNRMTPEKRQVLLNQRKHIETLLLLEDV